MKKLALLLPLLVSVSACKETTRTSVVTREGKETLVELGEPARAGNWQVVVKSARVVRLSDAKESRDSKGSKDGNDPKEPKPPKAALVIALEATNTSSSRTLPYPLPSNNLADNKGNLYDFVIMPPTVKVERPGFCDVAPEKAVTDHLAFSVPPPGTELTLTLRDIGERPITFRIPAEAVKR
jgi:hypothetical protein